MSFLNVILLRGLGRIDVLAAIDVRVASNRNIAEQYENWRSEVVMTAHLLVISLWRARHPALVTDHTLVLTKRIRALRLEMSEYTVSGT